MYNYINDYYRPNGVPTNEVDDRRADSAEWLEENGFRKSGNSYFKSGIGAEFWINPVTGELESC